MSDDQNNPTCSSGSRGTLGKGSDNIELRGGSSFGARGAMSLAAAAMAGLASGNSRGVTGGRDQQGRPLFGSNDPPRLIFTAGGKQLNRHLTIYQSIQRQLVLDEDDDDRFAGSDLVSSDGTRLWTNIYTIMYQRADCQADRPSVGTVTSNTLSKSTKAYTSSSSSLDSSQLRVSLLDSILLGELPCDLERSNPTYNILALLRVLEGLNQLAPRLRFMASIDSFSEGKISSLDELGATGVKVPSENLINSKLTPKLARQIQDTLALCSGSLPSWCYQLTKACPFLFPFETRRQYFYSTAFGLSRALYRLQQQQGADGHGSASERELRIGRLQRQKVRVSRNRILDSAAKVMEMYCSQKAILEVEYFGEVGTGLGPTLEFYTLLSQDLQKAGLEMWRSNLSPYTPSMEIDVNGQLDGKTTKLTGLSSSGDEKDMIQAPLGLFPRPWPPSADASDVAFYKLLLGQDLDLHDIISFDAELGTTLQELQALACRKQYLESMGIYNSDELRFRGASVEDLCLDFTLPGYPEYVLRSGDENVNINSLGDYISLVVDATAGTGIMRQMEAFRSGFNQVFDISTLQIFSPHELDYLLCGRREMWKPETLADHIKFDHGYTARSPTVINLLEIMGEFTPEQQRAFCQFVTGAPRLPPGGLAVLNPKLTIVRKHSSNMGNTANNGSGPSESADDDLPSVMTCANYLKLPAYSSKEIIILTLIIVGSGNWLPNKGCPLTAQVHVFSHIPAQAREVGFFGACK
ncbi:E3 ubiquitin-protein ligase UPL3 [Abeliophyllum distichum]|uniref:E3 ubiquitin-protein ligase UPL3 n=1 Tax=Abeliophyllum distichum TaxID=126358 RepID=A0ABD1P8E5_9LAMI